MKLSRILTTISNWFKPKRPMGTRQTHSAYTEQFVREDGTYLLRLYDYTSGAVISELEATGGKEDAVKHAKKLLKKYRRA